MKGHETAREEAREVTPGQFKDIVATMIGAIPELTFDQAERVIGDKGVFGDSVREAFWRYCTDPVTDWQNFYEDVFDIQVDFSDLQIPEEQKGFDRLIIVANGMTPQRLYDRCKASFACWKWTDKSLDGVAESERTAEENYAIWIRNRVEADEELKSKSADMLKSEGVPGITLEERLVYELKYFRETGKHLDVRNVTLCAGSRYSDGGVPRVRWFGGSLEVSWCLPDHRIGLLCSRQVVS